MRRFEISKSGWGWMVSVLDDHHGFANLAWRPWGVFDAWREAMDAVMAEVGTR